MMHLLLKNYTAFLHYLHSILNVTIILTADYNAFYTNVGSVGLNFSYTAFNQLLINSLEAKM